VLRKCTALPQVKHSRNQPYSFAFYVRLQSDSPFSQIRRRASKRDSRASGRSVTAGRRLHVDVRGDRVHLALSRGVERARAHAHDPSRIQVAIDQLLRASLCGTCLALIRVRS
jgi:hypothetical protein